MTTRQDLIYRQMVTLKDGARVLLRPLVKEDRQALIDFFAPVALEDRRYFRTDISNEELVGGWVDNLDYDRVLPIVAVSGDRIVGDATLHFHTGPKRHIAEVRIFLCKDFRNRGMGGRMLQALIDLAKRRSLYMLEVEIAGDQAQIIKAFESAGFTGKSIFDDYFMLPDGELRDMAHLVMRLQAPEKSF